MGVAAMSLASPLMLASMTANAVAQEAAPPRVVMPTDRTVLPIPEPQYPHSTVFDARNATPPPRFEVKAPPGAPNVLIVLIDDMGFGQSSAFGGPIHMPTVEGLAYNGLRYNEFHTTALCSPTRSALLSGRNHQMNNFGSIAETAPWEVSPTDRWPTRQGFDKFYGFMGGETNQWAPLIYDGMTQVEVPHTPGYNFITDMTDKAIDWMGYQKSLTPDKPFFIYFAPGVALVSGAST
jgi:arylsulfatase A-like enzyme